MTRPAVTAEGRSTEHPAVVLTLSPTGLAVARSLAPRGVRVFGVDDARLEIGHFSRWITRDRRIAFQPPGPVLLEALMALGAEQAAKPVLFTAGDPYIDFVAANHERLRERFVLQPSMRPEESSVILDKRRFYERCRELGVALAATYFPTSEDEAREASRALQYPAIVKPSQGHRVREQLGGEKLVEVGDADALVAWWKRLRDWGAESVLQEVILGPEANLAVAAVYTDGEGTCRSLFTARKTRQYPPMYGSGSYMEAAWLPDVAELSIEILRKLDYRGICGTEFKWDERERVWKLIEINPRPTLWYALSRKAGVDVVWDAYCDLTGQPNPVRIGAQDDSARWQLLVRDIVSGLHFLRRGELSGREFLRTVVDPRRKEYAVLSRHDLAMLWAYPVNTAWKWWRHRG